MTTLSTNWILWYLTLFHNQQVPYFLHCKLPFCISSCW